MFNGMDWIFSRKMSSTPRNNRGMSRIPLKQRVDGDEGWEPTI